MLHTIGVIFVCLGFWTEQIIAGNCLPDHFPFGHIRTVIANIFASFIFIVGLALLAM